MVAQETISIISAYAPQVRSRSLAKEKFWKDLEGLIQGVPQEEKILLGGDLNKYVGSEAIQFTGIHGSFGKDRDKKAQQPIIQDVQSSEGSGFVK
ncbi:hypothetical protein CR513_22465, partial [Mucuna pruriens]